MRKHRAVRAPKKGDYHAIRIHDANTIIAAVAEYDIVVGINCDTGGLIQVCQGGRTEIATKHGVPVRASDCADDTS